MFKKQMLQPLSRTKHWCFCCLLLDNMVQKASLETHSTKGCFGRIGQQWQKIIKRDFERNFCFFLVMLLLKSGPSHPFAILIISCWCVLFGGGGMVELDHVPWKSKKKTNTSPKPLLQCKTLFFINTNTKPRSKTKQRQAKRVLSNHHWNSASS